MQLLQLDLVKSKRWLNDYNRSHVSVIRFLFIFNTFQLNKSNSMWSFFVRDRWNSVFSWFLFLINKVHLTWLAKWCKKKFERNSTFYSNAWHTGYTLESIFLAKNSSNYISYYIQFRCTCLLIYVADNGVEGGIQPL